MATTTREAPLHLTREQAAEQLLPLLSAEPQSAKSLGVQIGYAGSDNTVVLAALDVLASRKLAKRIPNTAGSKVGGWVSWDSAHEARIAEAVEQHWPYQMELIRLDQCFVDHEYQRPLTQFVKVIERDFDPVLFQPPSLSDRGRRAKPPYAIMDGQTRWAAAERLGIVACWCAVYRGLTPEQEADIFWRLQKNRRGMVSFHKFRAQLRSHDAQSIRIKALTDMFGYQIGDGVGQIKSVVSLEYCYKQDSFALERALSNIREAWPDYVPDGTVLRGLHFFLRNYPIEKRQKQEIDDERLTSRLRTAGPDGLRRRMSAAKELAQGRGSNTTFMALAIQGAYLSGGRSK